MLYYAYIVNRWQKWGGGGGIEEARGPGGIKEVRGPGGLIAAHPPKFLFILYLTS